MFCLKDKPTIFKPIIPYRNNKLMTPDEFKNLLEKQVLIIDGAMGTMTQGYNFSPDIYGGEEFQMLSDILTLSQPKAVQEIHFKYFKAGANAVETNTLCSSPLRLEEHDFSSINPEQFPLLNGKSIRDLSIIELSHHLNKHAVQVARNALEEYRQDPDYDNRPLLVLGSLGPSNWVLSNTQADLKKGEAQQIQDNFYHQTLGLIDGGVDALLFETQQDILELKYAIFGAQQAMKERKTDIPIMAQVTVDAFANMQIFHTSIHAALTTLHEIGIHAFGINCGLGPDQMLPAVETLSRYSKLPISIVPNAGLPHSEHGQTVFNLSPQKFADQLKVYVDDYGVNMVGGCCGTTPAHIQELSTKLGSPSPKSRKIDLSVFISGPQKAIKLDNSESLIRIGERLNVRGSKKVRDAVENSSPIRHEVLEEVVAEQTRDLGLEILDVCMDSNVVNTRDTLAEVIRSQTMDFSGAMSLDSFDVEALQHALTVYPGRPIINSISLEEFSPGVDKLDALLSVTRDHAPIYIALTTGPEGPAVTWEKKLELARIIVEKAKKNHGVNPSQLIIDVNAFPIGSEPEEGLNFALESIKAIPEIKKLHPDLKTIIGVGNLTNGLGKKPYMRKVLTSVFLDEARNKGLDAAIVNPNHYVPVDSLPPSDYDLGKKIILNHDMDAFAEMEAIAEQKKGIIVKKKVGYENLEDIPAVCAKIKDGYKEHSQGQVTVSGQEYQYQDKIVIQVARIIESKEPLSLINDFLMPTMEDLGSDFAAGTVSLPHLLKSADVMKQVMGFLESYMKKASGSNQPTEPKSKGTVVMGTVYQDVHSIGKDLSKTLIENYGYKVVDLGVQVPLVDFIEAAKKHKAIAVGMSALLVQTSNHMITVSCMLKEAGLEQTPILIGGAPVNMRHAAFVALANEKIETSIRSNVFYCRSGMDGVNYLNQLNDTKVKNKLLSDNRKKLIQAYQSGQRVEKERHELLKTLPKRKVEYDMTPIDLNDIGHINQCRYTMAEFLPNLNQQLLFSLNWKYGGKGGWKKKGIQLEDLQAQLQEWIKRTDENSWLNPQAVFGLFYCRRGSRNSIDILDPKTGNKAAELTFNDVIGKGKKDVFNVSQFFNHGQKDIVGLQICTGGTGVNEGLKQLKENDREGSLLLQGLSNRVAEDLAEHVNQILNKTASKVGKSDGKRYSPGYPAMTDISNNKAIYDLLNTSENIGVTLTSAFEFNPTGTTAAVVCFHPQAGYH